MDNLKNVLHYIKYFELEYYFKIFITRNKANLHPYHNFYHTCKKIESTIDIFLDEQSMNPNLKDEILKNLIIADLYHDRDHSGGLHSDKHNINHAIDIFNAEYIGEDDKEKARIIDLIMVTQYPYKDDNKELIITEKIMRDSDMSSIITDNFFQTNVLGLAKELNIPVESFIDSQIKFMSDLLDKGFYTRFANTHYKPIVRSNLYLIETIKNLF